MNDAKETLISEPWTVRPLTRTRQKDNSLYHREPEVEAQVRELTQATMRTRKARLASASETSWTPDGAASGRLREETLVYFLREYDRRGDETAAWEIAETLIGRVAAHVTRALARWRLTTEDRDDCARDLYAALCEAVFEKGASAEFWEVRFWVCLDRRLWNLVEKRQTASDAEISPGDASSDAESDEGVSGDGDRLFARMANPEPGPEVRAEWSEARALLDERETLAVYLCYVEGLPEESDDPTRPSAAKIIGVTGRSVRNYLRRAKQKLRDWEQKP